MNGMERKVAERSAALECNGEKRKTPAAGFGRKTLHGMHLLIAPTHQNSELTTLKMTKVISE
jgi:hypothetical protein